MLLTRLILKSIIECLSRTQNLQIEPLMADEILDEDPFFTQTPEDANNRQACGSNTNKVATAREIF